MDPELREILTRIEGKVDELKKSTADNLLVMDQRVAALEEQGDERMKEVRQALDGLTQLTRTNYDEQTSTLRLLREVAGKVGIDVEKLRPSLAAVKA